MGLIERTVAASLRQRLFVLLCLAALIATGVVAYRDLPVEAFPDLTNNQVVVVTEAPGLAATEVEQRVTFPVETALMGVPGAQEVRSISKSGLSLVTVVFDDGVAVYFARQLVTERVADVRNRLPAGLAPTLGPVATAFGEIYQYLVESREADLMERKAAEFGNKTFLLYGEKRFSYADMNLAANRAAHALVSLGAKPRDGVAIMTHNSPAYYDVFCAAQKLGMFSIGPGRYSATTAMMSSKRSGRRRRMASRMPELSSWNTPTVSARLSSS